MKEDEELSASGGIPLPDHLKRDLPSIPAGFSDMIVHIIRLGALHPAIGEKIRNVEFSSMSDKELQGLLSQCNKELGIDMPVDRVQQLESAIRKHRDQRGDDRCWLDDEELYKVLPEGYSPPKRDSAVELKMCEKYISCRHNPNTEYISPQRAIEELEKEVQELRSAINCNQLSI